MVGNATWPDLIRVLVLLMGAGVVAESVVIIGVYGAAYLRYRRMNVGVPWLGLLPAHVALIGLSYLLLVGAALYEGMTRVHDPLTWRAAVYFIAYGLGLPAQWLILGHSRHRWRSLHEEASK